MPLDSSLVELVQSTAKSFAERHRIVLDAVEQQAHPQLPPKVLAEMFELGWLGSLDQLADAGLDPSNDVDGKLLGRSLLSILVFELGQVSPALATRLLCHHFARGLLDFSIKSQKKSGLLDVVATDGWLTVPVFEPIAEAGYSRPMTLRLIDGRLRGELHFVVGDALSNADTGALLCFAETSPQKAEILLVTSDTGVNRRTIDSLGLKGLGLSDLEFHRESEQRFHTVADGELALLAQAQALRAILPAYTALCRAILVRCKQLAERHAENRRQGGSFIAQLPQIREKLALLERGITVTALMEKASLSETESDVHLLPTLRLYLLSGTDVGLQVLGGAGYIVGFGLERLWRDARQVAMLLGHNLGALA